MKITLDTDWIKAVLKLQAEIYNHQDTPQTVKDFIELRLYQIFGKDYDIPGLLNKFDKHSK